jgi:hypothetical protein
LTASSRSHKAVYARPGCDGDDGSLQQPGRNIGGTLLPSPSRNQYLNFAPTNEVVLSQGVAHIGATSMYVTLQYGVVHPEIPEHTALLDCGRLHTTFVPLSCPVRCCLARGTSQNNRSLPIARKIYCWGLAVSPRIRSSLASNPCPVNAVRSPRATLLKMLVRLPTGSSCIYAVPPI